ncbi:glutamate decarboxylase [Mycotypha africana]|uniref:glutamate decarboxylase n=1 Tax=Mycotypha africana TaxID=64632 RepID=UPI0023007D99|nr:glutamate decarboxylase [Mycotypha africana]KAI8991473.1 glutamate decarboxylase [Mycotypha africana]
MVFLSRAIAADPKEDTSNQPPSDEFHETTIYGTRWASKDIPRYEMPDEEMPGNVAYRMIKDELALDGTPALNLATFVTTFMEDEAEKLMTENLSKNFIDFEEYPQTAEISNRCVNIIARLFHAPMDNPEAEAIGTSTVGSSEAIILSVLAMKRRWQHAREAKGLPTSKPNLIMGANYQIAVYKAAKYLDIEPRAVPVTEDCLYMNPKTAVDWVDENTIGVVSILGSTYTGHFEDVETLNKLLDEKCKKNDWDIGIHVDGASGGFVAPFVAPEMVWDFRLNRVFSINVSGHKYGLTYPGIGWAIWRSKEYLPEDLVFTVNYLGSEQATFTLNFSKGAANVIAQYYVLIRLGKIGFTHIMRNLVSTADYLSEKLEASGQFKILSARAGKGLPLVAFRLKGDKLYNEFDVSAKLREHGWIIPAYTMAHECEHIKLLRVVIREDFSRNRCELLLRDLKSTIDALDKVNKDQLDLHRENRKGSARHHHHANFKGHKSDKKDPKKHDVPGVC